MSLNNCKKFIQIDINNYSELDMQRFNLTLCACEQVMTNLNNEMTEQIMAACAEGIFNQIQEQPEYVLMQLTDMNEVAENSIPNKLNQFLTEEFDKLTKEEPLVVGFVDLVTNEGTKYVYMFNIDYESKQFKIFTTKGKKTKETEILAVFDEKAKENDLSLVLYEDLPRNIIFVNYTDIFFAFLIQKMVSEFMPFEIAIQFMMFNLLPFIIDEGELMGEGETDENFDDFEEVGFEEDVESKQQAEENANFDDDDDIDFDDDDFDDIIDDF